MYRMLILLMLATHLAGCATPTSAPRSRIDGIDLQVTEVPQGLRLSPVEVNPEVRTGSSQTIHLEEWPWIHTTVYAYEVGVTTDLGTALDGLIATTRESMEQAQTMGVYSNLEWGAIETFAAPTHPVTANGTRLRAHYRVQGNGYDTLAYLFYRPPFALKFRVSMPDHAHASSIQATDTAVRDLLPKLRVTYGKRCNGNSINVSLPEDMDSLPAGQRQQILIVQMAGAFLEHALQGCTDLEIALAMTARTCDTFQQLCRQPPWASAEPAQAAPTPTP